jgi:hypothetical protein
MARQKVKSDGRQLVGVQTNNGYIYVRLTPMEIKIMKTLLDFVICPHQLVNRERV